MSAPQSRWQWALPVLLVVAATGFGAYSAGLLPKQETASLNAWLTKVRGSIPGLSTGGRALTPPVLTGPGLAGDQPAAAATETVADNEPRLASAEALAAEVPDLEQQEPEQPPVNSEPEQNSAPEGTAAAEATGSDRFPELGSDQAAPDTAKADAAEPVADDADMAAPPNAAAEPRIQRYAPSEPRRFAAREEPAAEEPMTPEASEEQTVTPSDAPRGLGQLEEEDVPRRRMPPIDTAPVVDLPAEGEATVADEPEVVVPAKRAPKKAAGRAVRPQNTAAKSTKAPVKDTEEAVPEPGSKRRRLSPISDIETKEQRALPLREMAEIEKLRSLGDTYAALQELSHWYWRHPEKRGELQSTIDEMAEEVFFAPRPHFHAEHLVQPNDRLSTIAKKYNVPWEYLAKVNRVDPRKVRAGQKLKVVDGPFSAFVSLSNFELIVHLNGVYVRRFDVGIGKAGSSPLGTFSVKEKLVDPTYYGDEGVVSHNDPKNPLGERWIDIGDSFGIHGTIEPESIGKAESKGCIRLVNGDVEQVYDLLAIGSQVTIHR